ncbi:MAG: tRNA (uridine(34)/cytosine(34)/5-carboxymethylaminomethyluridine(34)-2'-O)-methyltransferase TrmL [Patescibacteria group bacterium]
MFHVVLYEPEIPQNTGNIARLCAATGAVLHLIEPLGFFLDDSRMKRAGLDYWDEVEVRRHAGWGAFTSAHPDAACWYFSTRGQKSYTEADFRAGDFLVFGPETRGLPAGLLEAAPGRCLRLPMRPGARSLNLANTVAVAVYEALRQTGHTGLELHYQPDTI